MKFGLNLFKRNQLKIQELKGLECLNCEKPLEISDNFCSYCGQKNRIKLLNFGNFINNLFSGLFNYDSRFWQTFVPLLIKPGKVSKNYVQGKRARFVNPFQLYLNVSIVFFLIVGISNKIDSSNKIPENVLKFNNSIDSLSQLGGNQIDSIITDVNKEIKKRNPTDSILTPDITSLGNVLNSINPTPEIVKNNDQDSLISTSSSNKTFSKKIQKIQKYHTKYPELGVEQGLDSLGFKKSFWNKFYYQQIITISQNYKQIVSDGGKNYIKKLTSYISIALFVFLPFFTLFLKLLYLRRKFSYMEHLVFVFHTQTVFFLLIILFYLIDIVVNLSNVFWVFPLLFLLYLYKALRSFYEQGRFKTIIKFILLNGFYTILASIGFAIVAVLSFIIG